MRTRSLVLGLVLSVALLAAQPTPAVASGPLFARSNSLNRYWDNFSEYWTSAFKNKSAVTMAVLGVGAVAIFIVTRGKWQK